jgi:uncharacterized protein YecT (DUF1311 family)
MNFFSWGKKHNAKDTKEDDAKKKLEKEHIENMNRIEENAQIEQEKLNQKYQEDLKKLTKNQKKKK